MTMDWNGPYFTVSDIRRLVEGKFTTGISAAERAAIDKRVANFLRTKSAPGISIAIARNDRLVYAKGFGYAKKPIWWALFTRGEPVSVWHRLRIASVTKPITSAAIFTLIEQGRFSLSDKVFGTGGLLGNNYGYDKLPAGQNKTRLGQITVQHLLEHTAGLPPNNGNDPMFIQPSMDHAALITWTLKNYNVASNPGSVYAYSNFGYCLLGRIIEARGFLAYPTYIQSQIMPLCDVQTVALAGDTLAERQRDEVVYYKSSGASSGPYDIPVARMDAHGGLISTAIDVVRFAIHLDGLPAVPDILSSASIASMTTPTSGRYAKGWAVDQRSIVSATGASTLHTYRNHNGSLPGTIAWIVNRDDDLSWAALVNAGNPPSTDDVLDLMWDIVGWTSGYGQIVLSICSPFTIIRGARSCTRRTLTLRTMTTQQSLPFKYRHRHFLHGNKGAATVLRHKVGGEMERKSGSAPQLGTLIAAIKERFRHGLPPLARSGPSSAQIASKQTWLPMLLSDPQTTS